MNQFFYFFILFALTAADQICSKRSYPRGYSSRKEHHCLLLFKINSLHIRKEYYFEPQLFDQVIR